MVKNLTRSVKRPLPARPTFAPSPNTTAMTEARIFRPADFTDAPLQITKSPVIDALRHDPRPA